MQVANHRNSAENHRLHGGQYKRYNNICVALVYILPTWIAECTVDAVGDISPGRYQPRGEDDRSHPHKCEESTVGHATP